MKTNLLIDTNLLLYALNKDSDNYNISISVISNLNYNLFLTSKNISEFFAVTSKLKIPLETVFNFYEDLKIYTKFFFPSEKSLIILENLIQKYKPNGNQVFDIEIVSIMLANDISHIATFNKKDFNHIIEIEILELPTT